MLIPAANSQIPAYRVGIPFLCVSRTVELHKFYPVFMCLREASGNFKGNGPIIPIVEDQDRDTQSILESGPVGTAYVQRTIEADKSAESVER